MVDRILDIKADSLKTINAILEQMYRGMIVVSKIVAFIAIIVFLIYLIYLVFTSGIIPDMSQYLGGVKHVTRTIKPQNTLWM